MSEDSLYYIIKHSVVIIITLTHCLIVSVMMLIKKIINDDIKIEQNLFNINDFSAFCILLTK